MEKQLVTMPLQPRETHGSRTKQEGFGSVLQLLQVLHGQLVLLTGPNYSTQLPLTNLCSRLFP